MLRTMTKAFGGRRGEDRTDHPINESIELFTGLSTAELRRARRYFTVVDADPGHVVGRQGQPCRQFVVVLRGQVGASFEGIPLVVLGEGSFMGEMALLDDEMNHSWRGTVSALGSCTLAVADPREFFGMLAALPELDNRIRSVATRRRAYLARLARQVDLSAVEFPVNAPA